MPFIFAKLQDKEYEFDVKAAILKHIEILGEYLPERTVINQMKAQLCFYAKNTRHAKDVRRAISELRTRDEFNENYRRIFLRKIHYEHCFG